MAIVEKRHSFRDNLLMRTQCRIRETGAEILVKLRNISAQGLMAEGEGAPAKGAEVALELRNLGWVEGRVAWVQDQRFGIVFAQEIDPARVRQPLADSAAATAPATMLRRPLALLLREIKDNPNALRRV
ncbi:PilZ domain-containing protein [Novosphingobium rosa]|uniref:PilZ domain-containing protein n=1 Tax=Novosphingobium rosa TaxID=76978 RepID=UPI00082BBC56|nr:PilZ domain-containing protein [Novosphingobium rosa]